VVEQLVQLRLLVAVEPGERGITRLIDLTMVNACRGATDELQRAAFSDPLTGCSNRRAFERDFERELARCARAELDLSVVAIDLDGLKAFNDTEGHAAGDRQLELLVDTLRKALRSMDGVYRLGGDEFGLVLADTSPDDAAVLIARAVRLGAPSFSWGTASYMSTGCAGVAELLAVADADLYARRRVKRASPARRRPPGEPADASLRLSSQEDGAPRPAALQAR
jgi:diguanylate cyclase (GGDEF)-like protein